MRERGTVIIAWLTGSKVDAAACHPAKYVGLFSCLSLVRQVCPTVKRVEAQRRPKITVLSIQVRDLPPIELGQVVEFEHIMDTLECTIE